MSRKMHPQKGKLLVIAFLEQKNKKAAGELFSGKIQYVSLKSRLDNLKAIAEVSPSRQDFFKPAYSQAIMNLGEERVKILMKICPEIKFKMLLTGSTTSNGMKYNKQKYKIVSLGNIIRQNGIELNSRQLQTEYDSVMWLQRRQMKLGCKNLLQIPSIISKYWKQLLHAFLHLPDLTSILCLVLDTKKVSEKLGQIQRKAIKRDQEPKVMKKD